MAVNERDVERLSKKDCGCIGSIEESVVGRYSSNTEVPGYSGMNYWINWWTERFGLLSM